jgi:lipase chaperone LimK
MTDDLVKRLRGGLAIGEEAADRIEELEKACKEWADVSQSNYQRAKAAEAKLEVAVVAFTDLEQDCEADYPPSHGAMKYYIKRALAELKGEQP